MAKTLVGALRVTLGLDSAEFAAGAARVQAMSQKMSRQLAVIGAAVSVVGAGVATALRGAINTADDMGEMAQKLGVPVESLTALKHAAKILGVEFEGLQGGLLRLSRGMADNPEKFEALGIAVRDAQGQMRPTADVLRELADRFQSMPDGAEKTALAMDLFGKSGAAMIPMLNAGSVGITALMDEAKKLGLVISQETADSAGRFNENLDKLAATASGVALIIAANLAPVLEQISAFIVNAANAFQQLDPEMQKFLSWAAGLTVVLGPLIIGLGMVVGALGALLSPVALTVAGIGLLIAGIATLLPTMEQWNKFCADMALIMGNLDIVFGLFIDGAIENLKAAFAGLQTVAAEVWEGIKTSIGGAIDWIIARWDELVGKLQGAIQVARNVGTAISEALSLGDGNAIGDAVTTGLSNGILSGRNGVIAAITDLGLSAGQALKASLDSNSPSRVTHQIGVDAATGLANGINAGKDMVGQAAAGMGDVAAGAMKTVGDLGSRIGDMFATAATNVLTGVQSLREAVGQLLQQVAQLLINSAMKSLFGNIFGGGGGGGGLFGGLPGYASGTMNASAGWAMVGEAGPELVRMRGGERVYDARRTDRMMGGGGEGGGPSQVTSNVYLDGELIRSQIETFEGEQAVGRVMRRLGVKG
jgi:hypothetical protein